jgi:hypothetical protein
VPSRRFSVSMLLPVSHSVLLWYTSTGSSTTDLQRPFGLLRCLPSPARRPCLVTCRGLNAASYGSYQTAQSDTRGFVKRDRSASDRVPIVSLACSRKCGRPSPCLPPSEGRPCSTSSQGRDPFVRRLLRLASAVVAQPRCRLCSCCGPRPATKKATNPHGRKMWSSAFTSCRESFFRRPSEGSKGG